MTTVKFKERCTELGKHICDYVNPSQVAQDYEATMKEITEHIGKN